MTYILPFVPTFLSCIPLTVILFKFTSFSILGALATVYSTVIPAWIIYQSFIYPFYISPLRTIPTVKCFPLFGNTRELVTQEVGIPQRKWHAEHGPIIRYFFPFGAEKLSVVDDESLKQMTVKNPYNWPKPARAKDWMVRVLGDGVLLAEGETHVHQRKALAPGFSIQSIKALSPIFWSKALLLSKLWREEMLDDDVKTKSFETLDWLNRTTLDIIGEAGFGTEVDSLNHPDAPLREAYRLVFAFDIGARIFHGLQVYTTLAKYLPVKLNRDIEVSRKIILNKATDIINEKQSVTGAKSKDIIGLIVRDNMKLKNGNEDKLSFETMRDQVMTFLGAGHDTTATGVAWTLHLLAKYPAVQTRLREEIREYMPFLFNPRTREDEDYIEKADADQLPYMENVCRESLRYIPPIPFTTRIAVADDTLCGYHIPKGTTCYIHSNAINRMSEYWGPTSNVFDPDRWDNLPATFTPNAYMTFLQGPRGCIGRKFAETEMKLLLCCLLSMYSFDIDPTVVDPEDWKMWRLVLRPRDGVTLKVTRFN